MIIIVLIVIVVLGLVLTYRVATHDVRSESRRLRDWRRERDAFRRMRGRSDG